MLGTIADGLKSNLKGSNCISFKSPPSDEEFSAAIDTLRAWAQRKASRVIQGGAKIRWEFCTSDPYPGRGIIVEVYVDEPEVLTLPDRESADAPA